VTVRAACGGKASGTSVPRRRLNKASAEEATNDGARASWKGVPSIGQVWCPIALYMAASTAERIAFHILNRKTGHRVHRNLSMRKPGKRSSRRSR
jgi:hypothetical protein